MDSVSHWYNPVVKGNLVVSVWKGLLAAWMILVVLSIYACISALLSMLFDGNWIAGFIVGFLGMGAFYGAVDWMCRHGIIKSIFPWS